MGKQSTNKPGQQKSVTRRMVVGRGRPTAWMPLRSILGEPAYLSAMAVGFASLIVACAVVNWSAERVLLLPDQIARETHVNRVDFKIEDTQSTQLQREEARKAAPQVYKLNDSYLDRLAGQLNGLPKAVSGKTAIIEISRELREEYMLTNAGLQQIQQYAVEGRTTEQWKTLVHQLTFIVLPANPMLDSDVYQNEWTAREYSTRLIRVIQRSDGALIELSGDAIELITDSAGDLDRKIERLVLQAGFDPSVAPFITSKIVNDGKPTLFHDAEQTRILADQAAENIPTQYNEYPAGDVLIRRGDRVDAATHYEQLLAEHDAFYETASLWRIWSPRFGRSGLVAIAWSLLGLCIVLFYPRIIRNPWRVIGISVVVISMLTVTVAIAPSLAVLAIVAPSLFAIHVLLLAYDQRLAFVAALTQAALVTLALGIGLGWMLLLIAGCGTIVVQLREVRNRNSLIRAAIVTAAVLGVGSILVGFFELPVAEGVLRQILQGALWAIACSFGVAFVVMGLLPTIERLFDITTGMTLAELRDPKQPLLRQLQQRAPGTYNHSLQVANIAEAAAESIGADGLLVYVGALYHDIGKMNKPEYFIENQVDGYNKHDKLSPAMSLLVIVGHVKDGMELGREYNLPRSITHFIEAHHGTTLVEYFYHAARSQADQSDKDAVDEVRFRYPGPRPQTKEAAILMLSDAVESATRAMKEPNPSRIESLVRELANKRLQDGQFDESDLTFRELTMIEDAIISRVCAIHHGRISYPSSSKQTDQPAHQADGDTRQPPGDRRDAARSA